MARLELQAEIVLESIIEGPLSLPKVPQSDRSGKQNGDFTVLQIETATFYDWAPLVRSLAITLCSEYCIAKKQ